MKKKIYKGLLAAAIIAAPVYFVSCGTGGEETSSTQTVKTASLTLGAKFKTGEINSQFVSQNVTCIDYEIVKIIYDNTSNSPTFKTLASGTITPDNPIVTVNNLPIGEVGMSIRMTNGQSTTGTGYDGNTITQCNGTTLDVQYPYMELAEGQNTFTATMIGNAQWTFVDSNGNPISINLNKTYSSSPETISSFDLFTWETFPGSNIGTVSVDYNKPSGGAWYQLLWKGSNFDTTLNNCADNTVCASNANYTVQFIGPDTSNNAFNTDSLKLTPYTDNNGKTWDREAFIYGVSPTYENFYGYYGNSSYYYDYSFSALQQDGTDVVADIESRFGGTTVINADTMQGIILEIASPDITKNYECAFDQNFTSTFTCPSQITSMALKLAVSKKFEELTNGVSAQSIDNNGCYSGVSINENRINEEKTGWYAWNNCQNIDLDGDGFAETYACDYNLDGVVDTNDDTNSDGTIDDNDSISFYIHYTFTATMDICVHEFTAKAGEIPTSDLNLTIQ